MAARDKHGLPVRASGSGRAWDHFGEVDNALKSLAKAKNTLVQTLRTIPPTDPAYARISREIAALSEMTRRTRQFLEIK